MKDGPAAGAGGAAPALERDAHGRLRARLADGQVLEDLVVVRAFPLSAPDAGFSLVGRDGREKHWIPDAEELDDASRRALAEALAEREMMPRIERIVSISSRTTPSEWQVLTDRGPTRLVLRAEEDIRRLGADSLLVTDRHGLQFRLEPSRLDASSRRLLDRFR